MRKFGLPALTLTIGLSAISLQLYFAIEYWMSRGMDLLKSIGQFFSYYTIWANLLVCACLIASLNKSDFPLRNFFAQKKVMAAALINIAFVAITYNVLLRSYYKPLGLELIVNEVLHLLMPILYAIFYFRTASKEKLQKENLVFWLIFPISYLITIFISGGSSGSYPYPFLNIQTSGIRSVCFMVLILLFAFFLLSFLLLLIDKREINKNS